MDDRPQNRNLRPPWPPGQSGNPAGRPKGPTLAGRLREALESKAAFGLEALEGRTLADLVLGMIVTKALTGDAALCRLIFDRVDGKVAGEPATMIIELHDRPTAPQAAERGLGTTAEPGEAVGVHEDPGPGTPPA